MLAGFLEEVNTFISSNQSTLTVIFVPILTLWVTARVSKSNANVADISQEKQRKLAHQLKLAEFRQAWIDNLREDFAIYSALTWDAETNAGLESKKERIKVQTRILLRLNPRDKDYDLVVQSLRNPVADKSKGRQAIYEIAQPLLKREWDRLKADLAEVDEIAI